MYGLNPLAVAPDRLPASDPWASLAAEWGDVGSPYGPLWEGRERLGQIETLIFLSWAIFFWYLLLAVPIFHAWYLLWSLPLAILLRPEQKPLAATIIFSATAMLVIPYFETIRVWYRPLLQNHLLGHAIGVPSLVLPPAVAAIWGYKKMDLAGQS